MAVGSTFTATISRTNGHGFQTEEQPGKWLNLSKFATPPPAIPPPGTVVRITVDGANFVRALEPLDEVPQPPLPFARPASVSDQIARLAVLKAAARYHAGSDADVLATAARWERWVLRELEPTP